MVEKIKRLITLYEKIIHGDEKRFGLFDCYDTYYKGIWDDLLTEVETLKEELNQLKTFQVGDQVTYKAHEGAKPEHGTVSTIENLPNGEQKVWVRYTTGGTGALTPANKLT